MWKKNHWTLNAHTCRTQAHIRIDTNSFTFLRTVHAINRNTATRHDADSRLLVYISKPLMMRNKAQHENKRVSLNVYWSPLFLLHIKLQFFYSFSYALLSPVVRFCLFGRTAAFLICFIKYALALCLCVYDVVRPWKRYTYFFIY